MVFNALEIDPRQVWKGPWRWYHETMLDCCKPLDRVKEDGISLDEVGPRSCQAGAATQRHGPPWVTCPVQAICLARCNHGRIVTAEYAEDGGLPAFRQQVMETTQRDDSFLVASYSRKGRDSARLAAGAVATAGLPDWDQRAQALIKLATATFLRYGGCPG